MTKHDFGVLVDHQIRQMIRSGYIKPSEGDKGIEGRVESTSLDLPLSREGYRIGGCIIPFKDVPIKDQVLKLEKKYIDKKTLLEPGVPYMFRLSDRISFPEGYAAETNPKSSTARDGVFSRVVTGRKAPCFDEIPKGYNGDLWVQVVTRFPTYIEEGISLSQLRPYYERRNILSDFDLLQEHGEKPFVYKDGKPVPIDELVLDNGVVLHADFENYDIIAYKAKSGNKTPAIDLTKKNAHDPNDFWDLERKKGQVTVSHGDLLILSSIEAVRVRPEYAGEMMPFHYKFGDFRAHYAGYFDAGFGDRDKNNKELSGTTATLELPAWESALTIPHGQRICRMAYERCMDLPEVPYGTGPGGVDKKYQGQKGATLSKRFKKVA